MNPEQLFEKCKPFACRADHATQSFTLRSNGADVSSARRDELLAKARAGEYVELDIDVLAYEQAAGVMNRNYVRFRDGSMMALGRTGKSKPFIRDHEQNDVNARAGTILESTTEKRDEGSYAIRMSARLTAPWAVELALRGLLSTVSIGWNPTGPIECSICDATIFTKCYHFPGDRLSEKTDADGNPIKVRDRNGSIVCEWIFTEAELVECSVVSVPGVPGAQIEGVQALLAAHPEFRAMSAPDEDGFLEETRSMSKLAVLATTLNLASTADEGEINQAVVAVQRDRDAVKAELAIANTALAAAKKEIEILGSEKRQSTEDKFVDDAIRSGRLTKADEPQWREFFKLAPARAAELMAARPEGSASPVGQRRQSAGEPSQAAIADDGESAVTSKLNQAGINGDMALAFAKKFGAKKPVETIAQIINTSEEG